MDEGHGVEIQSKSYIFMLGYTVRVRSAKCNFKFCLWHEENKQPSSQNSTIIIFHVSISTIVFINT